MTIQPARAARWPGLLTVAMIAGALGVFGGVLWERSRNASSNEPAHRQIVRSKMNDPDSAKFRNDLQAQSYAHIRCGEVNGRNKMGGMVGFRRYVVDLRNETVLVDSDADQSSGQTMFNAMWSSNCQDARPIDDQSVWKVLIGKLIAIVS